ncbi:hypothetical protein [Streptomyces sp. H27-D2]|uniref:hypothetical protein n=1 Tax=Streptomyces sp. H27-D2 TaxID=3046304 RepID=UPI002DBA30B3|nr:hypothetical protein [Streptomyces sp. H27-D2]MEC4017180.1 hypothetical protein [Streptomyces sp. H27-D2]
MTLPARAPALCRAARAEWGPLLGTVWNALAARKAAAIPMTLGAVCLTGLFQIVQNQSWGYEAVQRIGAVQASQPWWEALLRTPLSIFVPALDLPVWGALAQILIVFGVSEICLGRRHTLLIAYVATLAGTMFARLGVAVGPGGPFGLPAQDASVVDTGPSAAVVGLAVYVCWRYRARFTAAFVVLLMAAEVIAKPNLAGKEHLAAITAVLLLCAAGTISGTGAVRLGGTADRTAADRTAADRAAAGAADAARGTRGNLQRDAPDD